MVLLIWKSRTKIGVILGQIKLGHANLYVKELPRRWCFTIFICQGEKSGLDPDPPLV